MIQPRKFIITKVIITKAKMLEFTKELSNFTGSLEKSYLG
jgi:hypothetical protein